MSDAKKDLTPPLEGLTYSEIDFDGYREELDSWETEEWRRKQQDRTTLERANAINSDIAFTEKGMHKVALDLDLPAKLIPSGTEGHFHLYIDKVMTWENYKKLLEVLAEVGIIESGYAGASIRRGFTTLRLPWHKKVPDTYDD